MKVTKARKRKVDDMMVDFDNWDDCIAALEKEYTLSLREACNILMANRSWVQRYVRPHVHYIYLSNGIQYHFPIRPNYVKLAERKIQEHQGSAEEPISMRDSIWMNASEFDQLIRDNMVCSRQTIVVPIEAFVKKEKLKEFRNKYIKLANDLKDGLGEGGTVEDIIVANEGLERIKENLMSQYAHSEYHLRVSPYKRSKAEAVSCTPRDYNLSELKAVHDLKGYGDTDEEIYRKLFAEGDYRLQLELPDRDGVLSKKVYYLAPDWWEKHSMLECIGIDESVEWVLVDYGRFLTYIEMENQYDLVDVFL